mmetsp:Transcript_45953/g.146744  ORF Transcript_45953/g.146744 Transcript_45953/m.146744 type:complete len:223 (+) Transcript_45953:214-882(+)
MLELDRQRALGRQARLSQEDKLAAPRDLLPAESCVVGQQSPLDAREARHLDAQAANDRSPSCWQSQPRGCAWRASTPCQPPPKSRSSACKKAFGREPPDARLWRPAWLPMPTATPHRQFLRGRGRPPHPGAHQGRRRPSSPGPARAPAPSGPRQAAVPALRRPGLCGAEAPSSNSQRGPPAASGGAAARSSCGLAAVASGTAGGPATASWPRGPGAASGRSR